MSSHVITLSFLYLWTTVDESYIWCEMSIHPTIHPLRLIWGWVAVAAGLAGCCRPPCHKQHFSAIPGGSQSTPRLVRIYNPSSPPVLGPPQGLRTVGPSLNIPMNRHLNVVKGLCTPVILRTVLFGVKALGIVVSGRGPDKEWFRRLRRLKQRGGTRPGRADFR